MDRKLHEKTGKEADVSFYLMSNFVGLLRGKFVDLQRGLNLFLEDLIGAWYSLKGSSINHGFKNR